MSPNSTLISKEASLPIPLIPLIPLLGAFAGRPSTRWLLACQRLRKLVQLTATDALRHTFVFGDDWTLPHAIIEGLFVVVLSAFDKRRGIGGLHFIREADIIDRAHRREAAVPGNAERNRRRPNGGTMINLR